MNGFQSPFAVKYGPPALVVAVVGLVLAWLIIPGWRPQDSLARRWQSELPRLQGEQLQSRLAQLASLDDAGLPVLAAALYCDRDETADGALVALESELTRWQTLPPRESSVKAARLARELARQATLPGATRNRAAAELATRILVWPVERSVVDNSQLISDCEIVLRATAQSPPPGALVASPPGLSERKRGRAAPQRDQRTRPTVASNQSEPIKPTEFGGDLEPIPITPLRVAPGAVDEPASETPESVEKQGVPPARLAATSARQMPPRRNLKDLPELELMQLLHLPDEEKGAEQELMRRGYTAIRLSVARRLTDRSPSVRRELAELLPQMSGLDARPWLLWLSRDSDPSVRRAAASIIATSTDPQLLARLREMRDSDGDTLSPRQAVRPGTSR